MSRPDCCPVCSGDCGSANPPVLFCPMLEPQPPCRHRYVRTGTIGGGVVVYECTECGDVEERDVS